MKEIKHYVLPQHTNGLYKNEAISSISLTKEVASKINELVDAYNELNKTNLAKIQEQDGKIRKGILYMKDNLINTITDLLEMYIEDDIVMDLIRDLLGYVVVDARSFGVVGNGTHDDTQSLQRAINYCNEKNVRELHIAPGTYLISEPLVLNGCSIVGTVTNVLTGEGAVIKCATKDFTAIKQGELKDNMLNIENIMIQDAKVGLELNYVVNSHYSNIYIDNCETGIKLGDSNSVGSLFNVFDNLYIKNCDYGIYSVTKTYFNNNVFNNGYIAGNNIAFYLECNGGYGAINNTFNNVEFRSKQGRGIVMKNTSNTIFNSCYFECGGNAIRTLDFCNMMLNGNVYASFKATNNNNDSNVIYAEGGFKATIIDGTIFLTDEYINKVFFGCANDSVHSNIVVVRDINKTGSASGFKFFNSNLVKQVEYVAEEQTVVSNTVSCEPGKYTTIQVNYPKEFSKIPNVTSVTMRGADNICNSLTYLVSERTKDHCIISVHNGGSTARSVSFSVYAKIV